VTRAAQRLRRIFAAVACIFFAGAVFAAERQTTPRKVVPRPELSADEKQTIELFRRLSPSVVYITTIDKVMNLLTLNVREVPRGTGSGFVWEEQGGIIYVVTNNHVIAGARGAQVRFSDQRSFVAELVGVSAEHDLAVLRLKVPEGRPMPLPLGSSNDLQVGQKVLAIGNPFGLDHSLTTGVISALDRSIAGDGGSPIHHLIQTDAAINPGNSGGPLLDSAGRLIGVNTAIYSPSGASAGIGFAVPADTVNRVVPELIAYGQYRRPTMGIAVFDKLSSLVTQQLGIKGVLVADVEANSPAAQAGLRGSRRNRDGSIVPGDVIQSVDGVAVDGATALDRVIDDKRPGDRITLVLWRDGRKQGVSLTLISVRR
jgi:S1-C subfamily serine protease